MLNAYITAVATCNYKTLAAVYAVHLKTGVLLKSNSMKKTFIVMAALVLGGASVKAQDLSYGIKAGIQQNTFRTADTDGDKSRLQIGGVGFHVGAFANYALSEQFSLQPQLLFNSKSVAGSKNDRLNMYAIDLPVNILYKHQGFFAGIGPNFSYGISAKSKSEGESSQDWYKKYEIGDKKLSMLKRFELGANATLGYQFSSGLVLSTNYMQGLSNILGNDSDDVRIGTRYIGLSVGYVLSGK